MFELIKRVKINEWFVLTGLLVVTYSHFYNSEHDQLFAFTVGMIFIIIGAILSKFDIVPVLNKMNEIYESEWNQKKEE